MHGATVRGPEVAVYGLRSMVAVKGCTYKVQRYTAQRSNRAM